MKQVFFKPLRVLYFRTMKILLCGFLLVCLSCYIQALPSGSRHKVKRRSLQNIIHSLDLKSSTKCTVCKDLVKFFHGVGSIGIGEKELIKAATYICKKAKIASDRVCVSGVKEFAHEVWSIFIDAFVEPDKICGWILGDSCMHYHDFFSSWNITIPERSPVPVHNPWKGTIEVFVLTLLIVDVLDYLFLTVMDL